MLDLWPALIRASEERYAGTCGGSVIGSDQWRFQIHRLDYIIIHALSFAQTMCIISLKCPFMLGKFKYVAQVRAPGFDGLADEDGL